MHDRFADPSKLNHAIAFKAYQHINLDPARLARDAQDTFAREVNELHDELMAGASTDAERQAVTEQMQRYERNYLYHITAYLKARAAFANAPEREGAADALHAEAQAKLDAFQAWRDRASAKIRQELAVASAGFQPVTQGDGFSILVCKPAGRAQVKFDAKPLDEVRAKLKEAGWRWASKHSAWEHLAQAVPDAKKLLGVAPGFAERETARRGAMGERGRS